MTDPTPSVEALCEAALARIRQVEPHDEWSAPIRTLVARTRELESEVERWRAEMDKSVALHVAAIDALAANGWRMPA